MQMHVSTEMYFFLKPLKIDTHKFKLIYSKLNFMCLTFI